MLRKVKSLFQLASVAVLLPVISGCGGGGGGSLASFLFGNSAFGSSGGTTLLASSGGSGPIATIVNPEPSSMLLLGSGMAAMTFYRATKNRKKK